MNTFLKVLMYVFTFTALFCFVGLELTDSIVFSIIGCISLVAMLAIGTIGVIKNSK